MKKKFLILMPVLASVFACAQAQTTAPAAPAAPASAPDPAPASAFTGNINLTSNYKFRGQDQGFKVELIEDLVRDQAVETVSLYRNGPFEDLCRGPHGPGTGRIKAIKLNSLAGAYWRGDESRAMLTRIYGTAFFSKKDLDLHLAAQLHRPGHLESYRRCRSSFDGGGDLTGRVHDEPIRASRGTRDRLRLCRFTRRRPIGSSFSGAAPSCASGRAR